MPDTLFRNVRVRFAPSPTGNLHIGGLRTALYNFLFARKKRGAFLLRIEDTDQERLVEGAEEDVLSSLAWAGLSYDEGPQVGGPHEPYYQSERRENYARYARQLVEEGHAYYAFDTLDDLERMRERFSREGRSLPKYDVATRPQMTNSLTLSEGEVQRRLDAGEEHVIRMMVPPGEVVRFNDLIRGPVSFESETLDDQVLIKSDGLPTYHLANVVDDHEMGISHVIRGEEWLPSTPKHALLYRFFGWRLPEMAHLPLIMSPSGGKLSKRNAEELGIPVNVRQYREAGYEPEALVNFLAFLGWNPGTEEEIFSLEELVDAFSLERVGSSGVQFNLEKLNWYNEQHIRRMSPERLLGRARPYFEEAGLEAADEFLLKVVSLLQERITLVRDLSSASRYFFEDPAEYEESGVQKRWKDDSAALVTAYADRLDALDGFTAEAAEEVLRQLAEEEGVGAGRIIHPARLAVSGVSFGPSLFHLMETIGKETCTRRMRTAAERLK